MKRPLLTPFSILSSLTFASLVLFSSCSPSDPAQTNQSEQTHQTSSPQKASAYLYAANAKSGELISLAYHDAQATGGKPSLTIIDRKNLGTTISPLTFHPEHKLLYTSTVSASQPVKDSETYKGFAFTLTHGKPDLKAEFPLNHAYCYLNFDQTKKYLLTASYRSGHTDIYPLDSNGIPEKASHTQFENRKKAHTIHTSPDNRFLYVPFVKEANALFQYSFDANTGTISPLDPAQIEIPTPLGPRHLAFHPTKPILFSSNEQNLGASSFAINPDGTLKLIGVYDSLNFKPEGSISCSDITITPDEKFLFVGLRSREKEIQNQIIRYAIKEDGSLKLLGLTPCDPIPWSLQLTPDGKNLFLCSTQGGTITAYTIESDGNLTEQTSVEIGTDFRHHILIPASSVD